MSRPHPECFDPDSLHRWVSADVLLRQEPDEEDEEDEEEDEGNRKEEDDDDDGDETEDGYSE